MHGAQESLEVNAKYKSSILLKKMAINFLLKVVGNVLPSLKLNRDTNQVLSSENSSFTIVSAAHLGRQQVHLHDVEASHPGDGDANDLLQQEGQARDHEPLPEVGAVDHQQRPDPHVGQVGPVEHLVDTQTDRQSVSVYLYSALQQPQVVHNKIKNITWKIHKVKSQRIKNMNGLREVGTMEKRL